MSSFTAVRAPYRRGAFCPFPPAMAARDSEQAAGEPTSSWRRGGVPDYFVAAGEPTSSWRRAASRLHAVHLPLPRGGGDIYLMAEHAR